MFNAEFFVNSLFYFLLLLLRIIYFLNSIKINTLKGIIFVLFSCKKFHFLFFLHTFFYNICLSNNNLLNFKINTHILFFLNITFSKSLENSNYGIQKHNKYFFFNFFIFVLIVFFLCKKFSFFIFFRKFIFYIFCFHQ